MTKFYLYVSRYLTVLLFLITTVAWSQSTVTGKVTSADDGSGLPGVNIIEKGTSNGTVTDANGSFSISVPENAVLVFSFVGYTSQEVAVGGRSSFNVALASDVTALSEVVVIGYGQIEKKDATGALVSLKPGDFNAGVINSPEQLIQGRAAGVQITSASGEPGAGINIRIRGTSSVRSGNNPLFVVDGVPLSGDDVTASGSGAGLGSSSARNPLNFINPNDIASIDILKDASATAIYGSRGANGVVIITTKTGKGASSALDYSYNFSVGKITKKYDLLNRQEFLDAYESFNGAAAVANVDGGADTDWQDEILRTAITHNHNLAFGAGDKTSNYRLSLGYMDQEGIIKISGLKRYTARFNGSKSFIDDRLKVSTQLTLASTRDNGAPVTDNSGFEGDLIGSALKANPTLPVRNANGTFYQVTTNEPNPAAILAFSKDYTNTIRGLGNVAAELTIVKGLTFKTVLGFDKSMSSRKTAFSRDLFVSGIKDKGRLYLNDIETSNTLWENYFTYDKEIGTTAKLNALVGYSYQSFSRFAKGAQYTNFRTSNLDQMINNLASADQTSGKNSAAGSNSSNVTDELQSFYGRFNLTLKDRYIVTATLRADGSTKFGGDNKYGYFPSAAIKWRVIEEGFVPEVFSDLNLRVGYGITGNQEIPHNQYQERQRYNDWNITNEGNMDGGALGGVAFQNPDLKWESTSQLNAGIDYGFLDNRIRGSIDYYYKSTNDLLIQVTSAQPAVQPFVWRNLDAQVINRGLELALEFDAISQTDFSWTINGNVAFNKNEVKDFNGLINTGRIHGQGLSEAYAQRIAGGQSLYAYYLRPFIGFDENGLQQYRDDQDIQEFTGDSPLPKTIAGLTNNLKYKALDLSFFFTGQFGQKIYNNTANAFFTAGALASGRNTTRDVVGSGESRVSSPDVSTRFLEDGSFVRLQNVTLGYNVNTSNTFISSLRFFVTGQNLFVITDYSGQDPEVNTNKSIDGVPSAGIDYTSYPRARVFTLGVNVSFK
ncbi:SusC/RagA family TonB-linked outer membrane protein [Ohtaekwangia kribbensis]|jgi:TonB-linked SusC/RagA family outer membrane protein|uniref:SusC/RagA family TonB-linked outer membrane protein n=1 Tax=Ohtaekwangia kribbensis TaxID=688913 RepID=A0ABW3JVJ2_9BACT